MNSVELSPQSIAFECDDGARNVLHLFRSTQQSPNKSSDNSTHQSDAAAALTPVVVVVPAMGVPARKYIPFCQALNAAGVHAACFDLRGVGDSSLRASRSVNFSYHTIIEQEFPAALAVVRSDFGNAPVILTGHSLGGQLSALYLASAQLRLAEQQDAITLPMPCGLGLIASCSIFYKNWPFPSSYGLLLFTQFSALLAKILGYFPGKSIGFGGLEARGVIADWARSSWTGRYDLHPRTNTRASRAGANQHIKHIGYEARLGDVTVPVMSLNFSGDTFAPLVATRHLVEKLNPSDWRRHLFDPHALGSSRADHYEWMRYPVSPAQKLASWALTLK